MKVIKLLMFAAAGAGLVLWVAPGVLQVACTSEVQAEPYAAASCPSGGGLDSSLPARACLVNEQGNSATVQVVEQNVRVRVRPDPSAPSGEALQFFLPYFLFPEEATDGEGNRWCRVGRTEYEDGALGWIPARVVERWDHRVVIYEVPGAKGLVQVYADFGALEEIALRGRTSHRPIGSYRMGRTPAYALPLMPWPVLECRTIKTPGGVLKEAVRINFIGRRGASSPPPEEEEKVTLAQARRLTSMVDVVTVIDGTGSMTPYQDAVVEAVLKLVSDTAAWARGASVEPAFGSVSYRDYRDASWLMKALPLGGAEEFAKNLPAVSPAEGGDEKEALFDAVKRGLESDWRGRGLSARLLIVVADAPGHPPGDPQNPDGISVESLVGMARTRNVRICGLAVTDDPLLGQQLQGLAGGTGGICVRVGEAAQIVERIKELASEEARQVSVRHQVIGGLEDGLTPERIAEENHIELDDVTAVITLLEGSGLNVSGIKPGETALATGWIDPDTPGLGRFVFVSRSEVDVILGTLRFLKVYGGCDIGRLATGASVFGRINPYFQFLERRQNCTLEDYLRASRGLPVGRTSILRQTPDEIRFMTEDKRERLRVRIEGELIPNLIAARSDDAYWPKGWDFGTDRRGLIPEGALP